MQLAKDGVEYARVTLDPPLDGSVVVLASIDRETWTPTITDDVNDPGARLVLLQGPDATGDGVVVPTHTQLYVKALLTPETVVRVAGRVLLF